MTKRYPVFEWGQPFEGWARNHIRRQFWRVAHVMGSEEDALQECALIFTRCRNKYEGKVDNPRWMMSLFQRAVHNSWVRLSAQDSNARSVPVEDPAESVDYNYGPLGAALADAGAEIQAVALALINSPGELLDIIFKDADAGLINRRARRLLHIDAAPERDLIGELRQLLRAE